MANEIKKILVPLDFTKNNKNFLHVAAAVAARHSAKIHLLNVVNPGLMGMGSVFARKFYYHRNTQKENSSRFLNEQKKNLEQFKDIDVEVHSVTGSIANTISRMAQQLACDLVILGVDYPKKRPGFISSNTYEIIMSSDVPVITVPCNSQKSKFSKMLFPVRDTEGVMSKFEVVLPLAKKNQSKIKLLGIATDDRDSSVNTVTNALKLLDVKMRKQKIDAVVEEVMVTDFPEDKILNASEYSDSDLMVINVSTEKPLTKLFKNNFTENIIYKSKIPVLFYRKLAQPTPLETYVAIPYPMMPV